MAKVKVLIVEDELIIAEEIRDVLEELDYEVYEPANTYTAAIEAIEEEIPDIAIVDINLSGRKTGIDLAAKINSEYNFPFIFLTSNTDRITLEEAKQVEPLAYLVKPYSKQELFTSIEVALYNYSKQRAQAFDQGSLIIKNSLFIKQNKAFIRLNFEDILYLVSDHVYMEIVMTNGKKHTVRGTLNEYMNRLGPNFVRSNRSYIAYLDHLVEINHGYLILNGAEVPVGKKQRDDILSRLNRG